MKMKKLILGLVLTLGCLTGCANNDTYKAGDLQVVTFNAILQDSGIKKFQNNVNNWLLEHSDYEIIDIQYSFDISSSGYQFGSCIIIYKV